jgi:hypothetical protein
MDATRFDTLVRSFARGDTRRRILAVLAALPLGGLLLALGGEEAAAERPRDRLKRRNKQHHRKRRNQRRSNKHNNKKKGGGKGGSQCAATGSLCEQHSDCCTNNCFNFVCAARVTTCGAGDTARQCVPPARGCAGGSCCYGSAGCGETCCQPPANQCNPQDECCAPNCAGRQCGDDGCGAGGTCGTCPVNATCNESTGQCESTCTPQCQGKQCGPDGCGSNCGSCSDNATCNESTGQCICDDCEPNEICCSGQCVTLDDDHNNCGACGHQCIPPTVCSSSICCIHDVGSPCSASQPCCGIGICQNGACCAPSGQGCNQNPANCCSGQCNQFGACV